MILCYGSINPDLVHYVDRVPSLGDDLPSQRFELTFGGGAANVAVCLAAWHHRVRIAGNRLGTDPLADFIVSDLERRGVDASLIVQASDSETPHTVVLLTPDGERTIIGCRYRGVVWTEPEDDLLATCEVVVIDGYSGEAGARLAARARNLGVAPVGLDVSPEAAPSFRLVVWSRQEHELEEAVAAAEAGPTVIITAGADQVTVVGAGRIWRVRPPEVSTASSVGAGDAFGAACALGITRGWTIEETVQRAAAAGALVASRPRGDPPPTLAEIVGIAETLLTETGPG